MQRARDRGLYSASQVVADVINCVTGAVGIASAAVVITVLNPALLGLLLVAELQERQDQRYPGRPLGMQGRCRAGMAGKARRHAADPPQVPGRVRIGCRERGAGGAARLQRRPGAAMAHDRRPGRCQPAEPGVGAMPGRPR